MFPGHYDGILEASKNFIKLEKNFSNWENVVSQMSNNDVCMRIIRNNNALISQSNLSYYFCKSVRYRHPTSIWCNTGHEYQLNVEHREKFDNQKATFIHVVVCKIWSLARSFLGEISFETDHLKFTLRFGKGPNMQVCCRKGKVKDESLSYRWFRTNRIARL